MGRSFDPVLNYKERHEYNRESSAILRQTADGLKKVSATSDDIVQAVDDLRWCDSLVLVYPTWWFNLPAMLKGYFDRVFLPGVAFILPTVENGHNTQTALVPLLHHIKKIGVVTTYGATRLQLFYVGDNGRRFISRGLTPLLAPHSQLMWHGLHEMDTATQEDREVFLAKVAEDYMHF
jgi:putative NADPH-quinone reductase